MFTLRRVLGRFALTLFKEQREADEVRTTLVCSSGRALLTHCLQLALIKLYHEYDVDRDGCLTVHVSVPCAGCNTVHRTRGSPQYMMLVQEFGTLVQHITNEDLTTKDKLALFGQVGVLSSMSALQAMWLCNTWCMCLQARALQRHTANRKAVGAAGDNVDDRDPEAMGDDVLLAEEFSLMCVSNGISPTKSDRSRGPTRTLTRGKSIRVTVLQAVVDEDRGAPSPFSSDSSDDDDEIVQLQTVNEFDSGDDVRPDVAVAVPSSQVGEGVSEGQ